MHWADEATLDLLKFLGRRIQRTRSLLVVTYRDDEVGTRHPLRLVIGELPRVPRAPPAARMRSPKRRLRSWLAALGDPRQGCIPRPAGTRSSSRKCWRRATRPCLSRCATQCSRDALRLTPASRAIAELVSLIPGQAEAWLLEEALASGGEPASRGVSISGMIRGEDGSLAFRHELARRALEGSIPQSAAARAAREGAGDSFRADRESLRRGSRITRTARATPTKYCAMRRRRPPQAVAVGSTPRRPRTTEWPFVTRAISLLRIVHDCRSCWRTSAT